MTSVQVNTKYQPITQHHNEKREKGTYLHSLPNSHSPRPQNVTARDIIIFYHLRIDNNLHKSYTTIQHQKKKKPKKQK